MNHDFNSDSLKSMYMIDRLDKLDEAILKGLVTRRAWMKYDVKRRHMLCMLGTLAPEVLPYNDATCCPPDVLVPWLALAVPWINDAGSEAAWGLMVKRFALVLRRSIELTVEDWRLLEFEVRAIIVRSAMQYTSDESTLILCESITTLLEREASGKPVSDKEWQVAMCLVDTKKYLVEPSSDVEASALLCIPSRPMMYTWSKNSSVRDALMTVSRATAYISASAAEISADQINAAILSAMESRCEIRSAQISHKSPL